MCRAVWAIVLASSEDEAKRLRRAAGAEVQVVGMAWNRDDLDAVLDATADVVVVDARAEAADLLARRAHEVLPDAALLWIGDRAPAEAHHAVGGDEDLDEILPSAITRALIARRR